MDMTETENVETKDDRAWLNEEATGSPLDDESEQEDVDSTKSDRYKRFSSLLDLFTTNGYAASFLVKRERPDDGDEEMEHGVVTASAHNQQEAIGLMYEALLEEFPRQLGWSPPHLVLADDRFFVFPSIPVLFAINESANYECPTCGDEDGPCDDPAECNAKEARQKSA